MKLLSWVAIGLLSERLRNNILNYPQKHICLKRMENHGCSPRLVVKVVCGEFLWSSLLKAHMLHCGFHMSQDRANHTYIICTLTMLNSFHGVELKSLSNPRENITSLSSPKLLAILVFGLEQINICGARMGFLFQHQGDALCVQGCGSITQDGMCSTAFLEDLQGCFPHWLRGHCGVGEGHALFCFLPLNWVTEEDSNAVCHVRTQHVLSVVNQASMGEQTSHTTLRATFPRYLEKPKRHNNNTQGNTMPYEGKDDATKTRNSKEWMPSTPSQLLYAS